MCVFEALTLLMAIICPVVTFTTGIDGPVFFQEAIENGNATLSCDSTPDSIDDELMLLVWYKDNDSIYSYDARVRTEWYNMEFNASGRIIANVSTNPTTLTITALREDDQALYHCRVEFLLSPTRNVGVNLTITVLPSEPFFLDELGNTVANQTRPYYEGDTLVLTCLVIGGHPPPKISWYSGETLVDATDGLSDIPNVRQNELFLPLTRENADKLSCKTTNTHLVPPLEASLWIELYLPAENVSIRWIYGVTNGTIDAGNSVIAQCIASGSNPVPDIYWSINQKRVQHPSNQTWDESFGAVISYIHFTPTVNDHGKILECVAVNQIMPPGRNSKTYGTVINMIFAPVVKIMRLGEDELKELDILQLKCDVKSNPRPNKYMWYYNDLDIKRGGIWGEEVNDEKLIVEEVTRKHSGKYSCAAQNEIGETRADPINIVVKYPPDCLKPAITLFKETLICNVRGLPHPDTYFWHIHQMDYESQPLTTGSASLPLSQLPGPFSNILNVSCEADNGISSQEKSCTRIIKIDHLKPPPPQHCDLAFEYKEFQIRCKPVENATHYELALWRLSTTNTSLILDHKKSVEVGNSLALSQYDDEPWLIKGALGQLKPGDEASAAACNRYGCSAALLLRPTDNLLNAAEPPWWEFFTGRDVGISAGVALLLVMFVFSTILAVRLSRRSRPKAPVPVIQVLQLDDVTRGYLSRTGDIHVHNSRSLRSNSSDYSDEEDIIPVDCHCTSRDWIPPPDVTLTLQRESAV